jgi:hypothetical protein
MARKRVLILGGGPGGVVAANNIVRKLKGDDVEVLLVDKTGYHVFQPNQLWVMLGQRERFPANGISVSGVGPWCGFICFTHTSWASVEPYAMGLPSEERYLRPMFIAPTTSLSTTLPSTYATLNTIFTTLNLPLAPLTAVRINRGLYPRYRYGWCIRSLPG